MDKKIIVIGDVHANYGMVNSLVDKKKPEIILQCGELGYWPKFKINNTLKIPDGVSLFFCDGNHDDHWSLNLINEINSNELFPNCFYMKRGSTLQLPDKRVILFMGGAMSIDKVYRTIGHDWFPEEVISQNDIYKLPNIKVDIVISHTCPNEFNIISEHDYQKDCSRDALSYILKRYKPKLWYFSHWHMYKEGFDDNCKWICLNRERYEGWWKYLD